MAKNVRTEASRRVASAVRQRRKPDVVHAEEQILRAATLYLIQKHGMLLVATAAREVRIKALRVWIITVTLRYTTGHEGYIGDLLYDGKDFMFLTEQSVMDERAKQVAADPQGQRKWNEYRASTLHPGEE